MFYFRIVFTGYSCVEIYISWILIIFIETLTVTANCSASSKQTFSSMRRMFLIVLSISVCVTSVTGCTIYLNFVKSFSNKKIRDCSMSYFQDKDKTSLFCITNLSKLTICKDFNKWLSRIRFGVAKCSVFWNYISKLN